MRRLGQIQLAEYRALVAENRRQEEQERALLAKEATAHQTSTSQNTVAGSAPRNADIVISVSGAPPRALRNIDHANISDSVVSTGLPTPQIPVSQDQGDLGHQPNPNQMSNNQFQRMRKWVENNLDTLGQTLVNNAKEKAETASQIRSIQTHLQSFRDFILNAYNTDTVETSKFQQSLDYFDSFLKATEVSIPARIRAQIDEMIQGGQLLRVEINDTLNKETSDIRDDTSTSKTTLRDLELKVLEMEQKIHNMQQEQKNLLQSMAQMQQGMQALSEMQQICVQGMGQTVLVHRAK
jgi:hypothetical protein